MAYPSKKITIKVEAIATANEISAAGGKQTLEINNHLIQDTTTAQTVANSYLDDYKTQKVKMVINRPTPLPYEIADTIWQTYAVLPYAPAVSAEIPYASAASGVNYYSHGRHLIIRKLNVNFSAGNYISVIELES